MMQQEMTIPGNRAVTRYIPFKKAESSPETQESIICPAVMQQKNQRIPLLFARRIVILKRIITAVQTEQ